MIYLPPYRICSDLLVLDNKPRGRYGFYACSLDLTNIDGRGNTRKRLSSELNTATLYIMKIYTDNDYGNEV